MQGVQSAEPFLIPASNEPSGHARMHIKAIFGSSVKLTTENGN